MYIIYVCVCVVPGKARKKRVNFVGFAARARGEIMDANIVIMLVMGCNGATRQRMGENWSFVYMCVYIGARSIVRITLKVMANALQQYFSVSRNGALNLLLKGAFKRVCGEISNINVLTRLRA